MVKQQRKILKKKKDNFSNSDTTNEITDNVKKKYNSAINITRASNTSKSQVEILIKVP